MKKITQEQIEEYMPIIYKLVRSNHPRLEPMIYLRSIIEIYEKYGNHISEETFNRIVLKMPLTDIMLYRKFGLDFPKHSYGETLED